MRTNYTEDNEDTTIRGISIGGSASRSINMWSIVPSDDTNDDSFTNLEIYHSKARHSDEEENPDRQSFEDEYYMADKTTKPMDAIDKEWESRYKWSNDSQLYTELASPGFEETEDGYLVFFVGEKNPLDNNMTTGVLNTVRNIGVQLISKDL
jgi:hypothetical protein